MGLCEVTYPLDRRCEVMVHRKVSSANGISPRPQCMSGDVMHHLGRCMRLIRILYFRKLHGKLLRTYSTRVSNRTRRIIKKALLTFYFFFFFFNGQIKLRALLPTGHKKITRLRVNRGHIWYHGHIFSAANHSEGKKKMMRKVTKRIQSDGL